MGFPEQKQRRRVWGIALPLLVGGCLLPGTMPISLSAQVAAAVDPRLSADAARCLAIDNEVAGLNAQVRSGTMAKENWKQRTDALAAERNRITLAYGARNSPPYQGLVTEYNRLKTAAGVAAREAAAVAAKAKREAAAAEAQMRRDAVVAENKAKQAAAAAVATEQARLAELKEQALDADVSTVVEERLERARDRFYRDFGLTPPNAAAAVSQQGAAAQAARAGHVPPAAAELQPPFDQRADRLYQLRLPDRTKAWFAEVFPPAAEVVALFSDVTQQSAALALVERRLSEHTTGTRPYAAQAKIEGYQAARVELGSDPMQDRRLLEDTAFEAEVFAHSLPAYAQTLRARAAWEKRDRELKAYQSAVNNVAIALRLALLPVLLWLPFWVMGRQKFRWKRQTRTEWEKEMANSPLPPDLWWIEVPGFRYPVTLFSGWVYDKEVWTETNVTTTTTTTAPTQYSSGYTSTSTHVSSTVYHRYWMINTAGQQVSHKYSDHEFLATSGQKVSSIWSDQYWVLLSYNHATRILSAPAWWVKTMHTPPYWRTFGYIMLVSGGLAAGVAAMAWPVLPQASVPFPEQIALLRDAILQTIVPLLGLELIYLTVVRAIYTWRRGRHFRDKVVPRYRTFMEVYDPEIPEVAAAGKR